MIVYDRIELKIFSLKKIFVRVANWGHLVVTPDKIEIYNGFQESRVNDGHQYDDFRIIA